MNNRSASHLDIKPSANWKNSNDKDIQNSFVKASDFYSPVKKDALKNLISPKAYKETPNHRYAQPNDLFFDVKPNQRNIINNHSNFMKFQSQQKNNANVFVPHQSHGSSLFADRLSTSAEVIMYKPCSDILSGS